MRPLFSVGVVLFAFWGSAYADEPEMMVFGGPTMGTKYTVKVFDPPSKFDQDVAIQVDGLLRQVNDQMSTYLKTSEIGRFNESSSLDWFEVSGDTAEVVQFAQDLAEKTDGVFDVTVGPLVNAWSFGPGPRTQKAPAESALAELKERIGFRKLSVRLEPPALKKAHPDLQVDLSSIAKGHAVDRVVEFLNDSGAKNVFVDIGGEVRTSGSKDGTWWRVGIQMPDAVENEIIAAHALSTGDGDDQSMATSGDYRNFFDDGGQRYSHTIDPRSGQPVQHDLASVSVVGGTCMEADAWATAINAMGAEGGMRLAKAEGLNVLVIRRTGDGFQREGSGTLAVHADSSNLDQDVPKKTPPATNSPLATLGITFVAFLFILLAMAVGVIFRGRAISGSCGGLANQTADDGSVSCALCSNPGDACKELRERMKTETVGE